MIAGRQLRILAIASGIIAGFVGVTRLVSLWRFGRDDPSQYEQRVHDLEQVFATGRPRGQVLLSGSSIFEYWTTSGEDLAPLVTTNIGIGGTRVGDHLAFFDRMVVPFHPRVLVLYIGSNDMSGIPLYSKSAERTVSLIEEYLTRVERVLPTTTIYYVAVTESPARADVRDDIRRANVMLAALAESSGRFTFIDTAPALLNPGGSIDESLFVDDGLHLNDKGYEKFAAAIREGLGVEYARHT